MKKIINANRTPIMIDTDTLETKVLDRGPRAIDEIYVIPEDATISWKKYYKNSEDRTVDVKKGDIMITFYDNDYAKDFVIVSNPNEWNEAINNYNDAAQKAKEKWASEQKHDCPCSGDCECGK